MPPHDRAARALARARLATPASADGARGEAWSEWSRVEVDGGGGELRLSQLVARLEERFGHEVSFLSTSGGMLPSPERPLSHKRAEHPHRHRPRRGSATSLEALLCHLGATPSCTS